LVEFGGSILVVYGAIGAALFFDFVNGFHDAANSIATIVGTRGIFRSLHKIAHGRHTNRLL
jgi:PiT family inorganic phosphate transporter